MTQLLEFSNDFEIHVEYVCVMEWLLLGNGESQWPDVPCTQTLLIVVTNSETEAKTLFKPT